MQEMMMKFTEVRSENIVMNTVPGNPVFRPAGIHFKVESSDRRFCNFPVFLLSTKVNCYLLHFTEKEEGTEKLQHYGCNMQEFIQEQPPHGQHELGPSTRDPGHGDIGAGPRPGGGGGQGAGGLRAHPQHWPLAGALQQQRQHHRQPEAHLPQQQQHLTGGGISIIILNKYDTKQSS